MPSRHRVIAELIQRRIARGQFGPGSRMPSVQELAEGFGASSAEVQLALARLLGDGLIVMRDGLDAVVSDHPPLMHVMSTSTSLSKEMPTREDLFDSGASRVGHAAAHRSETTIGPSTLEVSDRLEIEIGFPVVHQQTVRLAGDEPAALEHAYYPHDIVATVDPLAEGDLEKLIDAAGYRRVGWVDTVAARLTNPNEAALLALEPGAPVLDHARVLYSTNGEKVRPVTYVRILFIGNRNRLTYEHKQQDTPHWQPPPRPAHHAQRPENP